MADCRKCNYCSVEDEYGDDGRMLRYYHCEYLHEDITWPFSETCMAYDDYNPMHDFYDVEFF